jgi:hypothetical protein
MDMAVFGVFFAAAIVTRKSAATHKRLSVLATTFLLGAGFSRAIGPLAGGWFEGTSQALQFAAYLVIAYGGINLLMAMAVIYDWITRRRVHPAHASGVAIILGCEILTICIVQHVPAWGRVAHWLLYWT